MHERAEERLGPNTCGLVEANSNVLFEKDGLGVCGWRRCVAGDAAASEGMSETLANLLRPSPWTREIDGRPEDRPGARITGSSPVVACRGQWLTSSTG